MSRPLKILTTALWAVCVLAMLGVVAGVMATRERSAATARRVGPDQPQGLPDLYRVPAFSLTDQDGRTVTDASLRGGVWVAGFIFTRCAGPCPMMTAHMAKMQAQVTAPNVRFVLFTVDPAHDTPAVLKAYADRHGADPARWHLLTGPTDAVYAAAAGMYVTALPATADTPIIHSERFLLVDADGTVRGAYDSGSADDLVRLATDATSLATSGRAATTDVDRHR